MAPGISRVLKLAAVPVLLVVALAFFAGTQVGNGNTGRATATAHTPNFGQTLQLIQDNGVSRVTLVQKTDSMFVVLRSGRRYRTGYPNAYVSQLITAITRHEGPGALTVADRQ